MKRAGVVPLRALVVEDEWPARNYLVELIEGTGLAEVVGAIATVDEARAVLAAAHPAARQPGGSVSVDVVFADVQLVADGDAAGLELVRELSRAPGAPLFVLATAFKDHALEAFELGVADYLLKPFTEERVEACLERLHARRAGPTSPEPARPARIVARRGRGLVFLDPSEVWAFEAADRLTSVHTAHGTFDVDLSLSAIEASRGRTVARVHRNWLVNAGHIKRLDRDGNETTIFVGVDLAAAESDGATATDRAAVKSGLTVPVARERAQGIREMLLSNAMGVRRT
jgi:DNA-binding LytR/AlgR family response regulator